MLTRIWRTEFDPGRIDELVEFAHYVSAPMFARLRGCLGHVYAVGGDTWITQTYWDSEESIRRAEASNVYRDVVARILQLGVLGSSQTTEVYEVIDYAPPSGD